MRDFDAADLRSKLAECVRTLHELLAAGHTVYLHCTAGTGRSPTVAIAHLHRCRGWKLDEASAYVTSRRQRSRNLEAILAADWAMRIGTPQVAAIPVSPGESARGLVLLLGCGFDRRAWFRPVVICPQT